MRRWILAAFLLAMACGTPERARGEPVPLVVDWRSPADSPASVAFLLDRPAGKDGFLGIAGGHFVRPDGRRIRLWGINVSMG